MNRLLEPLIESLGPDAVQQILAFRIDSTVQARIDDLADRCNEGHLTTSEKAEYEAYVAEISLINMLKAKARRVLSARALERLMDSTTRVLVRQRAGERCEYCLIRQEHYESALHIEHIVAKQHGGDDAPLNLALSCNHCNLHKGPNLAGLDPKSGQLVPLFNPRRHLWA